MKTAAVHLALAVILCLGAFSRSNPAGQDATDASATLRQLVLSRHWSQCEGQFHYKFAKTGEFSLEGTLLNGKWSINGNELILAWSGSAIVDRLVYDLKSQRMLHGKGDKFDMLPGR